VAYLIDAVIVIIGLSVVTVGRELVNLALSNQSSLDFAAALVLFADLVDLVFIVWYYPGQWAERGQTFGQRALHIMVVREDGELIGFGGGLLRFFVGMGILDNIVFGLPIGWLWPMWDRKKQAWHDKVAGTIVVRV
jgi:uncharacterized RDD family membrane protein YckC